MFRKTEIRIQMIKISSHSPLFHRLGRVEIQARVVMVINAAALALRISESISILHAN